MNAPAARPGKGDEALPGPRAAAIFLVFAFAYFLSTLVRAVTATLAPVFSAELGLNAGALGLLAGVYFLGFAAMQLPLGAALDRFGPRRVLLGLLGVAMAGCAAFAAAQGLAQLIAARLLIGVGVSACLMAPLTCYRRIFALATQQRANAWMLMAGSLGMLAATLPVQWLLPLIGWRGLFAGVAVLLGLAAVLIWRVAPRSSPAVAMPAPRAAAAVALTPAGSESYAAVFRHPAFVRMAPLAVLAYGGLLALQTLWIGPWLTEVAGRSPAQASQGLFIVNLAMLLTFAGWGAVAPRLARAGFGGERLIALGWPAGLACLALNLWLGPQAGAGHWALWCVATSVITFSQPAVAQAFAPTQAGRALSAFNLLIFVGVFLLQWGIGVAVDVMAAQGIARSAALRFALAGWGLGAMASYVWLLARGRRGGAHALGR